MRTTIARCVFPVLAAVLAAGALAVGQVPGGSGDSGMRMSHGFSDHHPPFERSMGDQGRWWKNPHMIQMLKLTDEQCKAMDEIWYQHREKLIDLQANLERSELAMDPLMSAAQPNQAAMEAQIDKIVTARADLEKANAFFLLDIRMKLTPDQWKQLKDMRTHMMEHRRGMMSHRGGMMDHKGPGGAQGQMWHHSDGQGGSQQQMWRQHSNGQGGPPPAGNPPAGQSPPAEQQPQQQ